MYSTSRIVLLSCLGFAAAQNYSSFPSRNSSELAQNAPLPIIDLGYGLHQALVYNQTGNFYNFSNIRYARPPVGALRFAAPQPPVVDRSEVQNGSIGRICPQASPAWLSTAVQFVPQYLAGRPLNISTSSNQSSSLPPQDPRTTEDCLFLDVVVPRQVFEAAGEGYGAPVLVWIYGGGYTAGEKSSLSYQPAQLLNVSQTNGFQTSSSDGVIYVALNYRLGAFGWLSGFEVEVNGTANAGLYDQRLALEWIQAYIHLFGGDPNRVTVFGESAGGGSIMHQITAYGGLQGRVPFQQAIPQSPGFAPMPSNYQQEMTFNTFLSLLNVSTLEEARQLPSSALITANIIQVGLNSSYGTFTYGPVVDGYFVPELPSRLLAEGHFDRSVRVMVGHNANEGLLFTSPYITNNTAFIAYLQQAFPTAVPAVIQYIANTLYPPVFNGSYPYRDQISRASLVISEAIFTCNNLYLNLANNNNTYAYFFSVPPALHGQDIAYTFANGPGPANGTYGPLNVTVALALQNFITSFAEIGRPVGQEGIPYFNMYGANATVMNLNVTGISEIMDPNAIRRCLWWQRGLYD